MQTTGQKRSRSPKKVNKKRRRSKKSLLAQKLEMLRPNAAGIDVASAEHWVCVPQDRAEQHIRRFGTFTCDLYEIADWLKECEVTTVAMESTGVYWIPLYQVLEERGVEVCLVNAWYVKNAPGRPGTDREDCQWIQRLHSYGLLSASFRPEEQICQIRSVQRHRDSLIRQGVRHIQHMQKALFQMNLLLDNVISDITNVTGMAIIERILAGERNPVKLAQLRNSHIKSTQDEIAKALQGDYREEHLFVLRQAYTAYQFVQRQIRECDREIERRLRELDKKLDAAQVPLPPSSQVHKKPQKNEFVFDVEARTYTYEIFGVDLTQVPGFQAATVLIVLTEIGADLHQWKTAKHFTSWLGLAPNKKASGGKLKSSETKPVQSRAARAFRQAAQALSRSKSYLGAFYRRMRARLGAAKAITAAARKLAVIFYTMVTEGKESHELGEDYYLKQQTKRNLQKVRQQAKLLGYELISTALSVNQDDNEGKQNNQSGKPKTKKAKSTKVKIVKTKTTKTTTAKMNREKIA
jgi:transposase